MMVGFALLSATLRGIGDSGQHRRVALSEAKPTIASRARPA
jgi:hypothetical protein